MNKGAEFSPGRKHRYVLWRIWDVSRAKIMFIGLNPSTADENEDDPTIRRCINFAKDWGCYGGIYVLNLFAYRATKPRDMRLAADPIGADNDTCLINYGIKSSAIVACWGSSGDYINRHTSVTNIFKELWCFGRTKNGMPRHPLYVKKDTPLIIYSEKH